MFRRGNPSPGAVCHMPTSVSGSSNGRGLSSTPSDDAEDGRVGADAERQREDRDQREHRRPKQAPDNPPGSGSHVELRTSAARRPFGDTQPGLSRDTQGDCPRGHSRLTVPESAARPEADGGCSESTTGVAH